MLTGDNPTTAEALANKVDIPQDHVMAGMFPRDKARKVSGILFLSLISIYRLLIENYFFL